MPTISLIISTYNNPRALGEILRCIDAGVEKPEQVIIADDGSGEETRALIGRWQSESALDIKHCWHEDKGFRKNRILNICLSNVASDYVVFLDGDCLPTPRFVADHRKLAEKGFFVQGRRAFIAESEVGRVLNHETTVGSLLMRGKVSGLAKMVRHVRPIIMRNQGHRGLIGCNLAVWACGFDEAYEGWGIGEDSDLCIRLYNKGLFRKFVYGRALVYHLNHPSLNKEHVPESLRRLQETINTKRIRCERGLDPSGLKTQPATGVTACIVSFNEERNIRRCLESVKWCDEIVVVDSFSKDRTVEIAREYTDKVIQREWPGFRVQKEFARLQGTREWSLLLDADEEISPLLKDEMLRELARNNGAVDGYEIPRMVNYFGKWIRHGDWYPDRKLRLYRKERGEVFGTDPHDFVKVEGGLKRMKNPIFHYTYDGLEHQMKTINSYSSISAVQMYKMGRRAYPHDLFLRPFWKFLRGYLFKHGFLDGKSGLVIAFLTSFEVWLKYLKLRNLQRGLTE